jgi:asparagine synthase (glutamine-hydrolysing)
MCGVAGIFAYHYAAPEVRRAELGAISDRMAARGPDGRGEWFSPDGRVALGHRRLSIIDLSDRAAQPMQSADGALVISYNGEIYNHAELRRELERGGCVFRTTSDTEVILHMYAREGTAMLPRLRGMFAFALWDLRKGAVLLARDPMGIKPLYVADDGWTVRFASQVKALLASPRVSRAPESAGIAGFYLFGSVPEPFTLYQQIRGVPAGTFQWIGATGPKLPQRYWSLSEAWSAAPVPLDAHELQRTVREALLESVRSHLVADVPVGIFLSAGVDSSALLGLMADAGASQICAVTLGFAEFDGTPDDEVPAAREAARRHGARHVVRSVARQEFEEDLPNLLEAMDQPTIDGVNTWFVSKAAREASLKVAISGLGGDELFAGYPSFRNVPRWSRLLRWPASVPLLGRLSEQVLGAFAPLARSLHPKAAGMLRYGGTVAGAWLLHRALFLPSELPALLGRELARDGLSRLDLSARIDGELQGRRLGVAGQVATLEAAIYMRNQLLRDADWAGLTHSVEIRTPFVDAHLVRSLAGPLLGSATPGKALIAASPTQPLPPAIATRAKTGFRTPIAEWQRSAAQSRSWEAFPFLSAAHCPWARRWGYVVAHANSQAASAHWSATCEPSPL